MLQLLETRIVQLEISRRHALEYVDGTTQLLVGADRATARAVLAELAKEDVNAANVRFASSLTRHQPHRRKVILHLLLLYIQFLVVI